MDSELNSAIDAFEKAGFMTEEDRSDFFAMVEEDGVIDDQELVLVQRLTDLIEKGKIKVIKEDEIDSLLSQQAKEEAKRKAEEEKAAKIKSRDLKEKQELQAILDLAIKRGRISDQDYEQFVSLINRDGKIDPLEAELLSQLHHEIESGNIRSDRVVREAPEEKPAASPNFPQLTERAENSQGALGSIPNSSVVEPQHRAQATPPPNVSKEESAYSFANFIYTSTRSKRGNGAFELETDRFLSIDLQGDVWTKSGSMVAYKGRRKCRREGFLEHGAVKLLKKALTKESVTLTKAGGEGILYLADQGKKISVIDLRGDSLIVKADNLLAFQSAVRWDIVTLQSAAAFLSSGFFNVRLAGYGMCAITSHDDPIVLVVEPGKPIMTDPNATVAWSGSLAPQFKSDINTRTLIGRSSGETIQLKFEGQGFVVIQPYEEGQAVGTDKFNKKE